MQQKEDGMRVMNSCCAMKHLALAALFLAAAILVPAPAAQGSGIMVTRDLPICTQADVNLDCRNRVSVTAPVSYGDRAILDIAYIDTVTDRGGGESQLLEDTLRLELSKTPPVLRYPLRYLHTVSFQPHEELRLVQNLYPGVQACIDAAVDNPTCGWTLAADGSRIEDSQGFCSNRDLDQLQTYDPDLAWWRGEELCRQSTLADSFSVAHCLRTGDLHFTGYEIGEYSKDFTITATISKGTAVLNQIFLSPDAPVYLLEAASAANGHGITARLQDGISAAAGAPDLSNYILYVPTAPPSHPLVVDYKNNMLLVPREMVTIDGSECNKVGTDFRAFRAQAAGAAKADAGDCLANQLYHLYQQDLALLTQNSNAETKYLVTGKKIFKGMTAVNGGNELSLIHTNAALEHSIVHLTLDPATVTEVSNEAMAWIKEAYVIPFTSMTQNGKLVTVIQNVGTVQTDYIVSVTDCQPAINNGIPAQALTLNPNEEGIIEFSIDTTLDADSSHMCVVTLTASTGRKFDYVQVYFDTRKHSTLYARDLYQKNKYSTLRGGCTTTTTAHPAN
jgi:hypothetical protein